MMFVLNLRLVLCYARRQFLSGSKNNWQSNINITIGTCCLQSSSLKLQYQLLQPIYHIIQLKFMNVGSPSLYNILLHLWLSSEKLDCKFSILYLSTRTLCQVNFHLQYNKASGWTHFDKSLTRCYHGKSCSHHVCARAPVSPFFLRSVKSFLIALCALFTMTLSLPC